MENQYPYEYQLTFQSLGDADALLAVAETAAANSGVALENLWDYRKTTFMAVEENGTFSFAGSRANLQQGAYFALFPLEDYNRSEAAGVALAPDEALLLVTGGVYGRNELVLNGVRYRVRQMESIGKLNAGSRDLGRSFCLVLPGEAALQAFSPGEGAVVSQVRELSFDVAGDAEGKERFARAFGATIAGLGAGGSFDMLTREENRQEWYASNGGFLFLGVYFGILFMLAAALIIYYKQMSEGYDDAERFEILQKVGMGEEEVKRTINRQILVVFFLPLAVAVVHITVAFFPISRAMVVFGVTNIPMLVAASVFTVLAYTLVYGLVFRQTARTYFRIVRRQAATV
jgi:putative ABC transport system permease protein